MSINLLDTVKQYLTPDLISKASTSLGENENAINRALSGIIPAVISGLITKSNSGTTGANEVLNLAKESNSSGLLENIGNPFSDGSLITKGTGMLRGLFGNGLNEIVSAIASFAGIRNASANSLFSLVTALATASAGKYAAENNLDAVGLSSFLNTQKSYVKSVLPADITALSSLLGLGKLSDPVSSLTSNTRQTSTSNTNVSGEIVDRKRNMGWLLWVFLFVLAALAAWYFLFGGKNYLQ